MNPTIESNHTDGDNKLKNLISEKTSGIRNFFERVDSYKVIFEIKKCKDQIEVAEITFIVPQSPFFAKEQIVTFELALDVVVNELQQLKKYKEKRIS